MGRRGKGIAGALFDTGTKLVARAAETMLKDPRGQEAVARAVGFAQRNRKRFEEVQERVLQAAGVPIRQDYQDLAKQLARIKRKARELAERLESARADAESADPEDGSGDARRSR